MQKKYLVTGGTGFIGSNIVRSLLEQGHIIKVLDDDSRGKASRLDNFSNDIELISSDIRNTESVVQAAKGVDSIIHLAYVNGTKYFYTKPEFVIDVAIRGMLSVIDACKANDIGELVLASSSEVYQYPPTIPTPENVPLVVPDVLNPRYSYGGGKLACELMAVNYGRELFERVLIFRPHNIYGRDMGWEHVIPQLVQKAKRLMREFPSGKIQFPILGDGSQTRAFCHVDDLVSGFNTIIARGEHLGIYHIGNPEEVTIAELTDIIFKYLGREFELTHSASPLGETVRRCPDISKIAAFGFQPTIPLTSGIRDVVDWYMENISAESE